jgi:hypothetical protein
VGFGVLSGSGRAFFLRDAFLAADFVLTDAFFFLVLDFGEALFELLGEGVGRALSPSSSSSLDFDVLVFAGELFGFGVGDSSSSESTFAGVFFGLGAGVFFLLGDGLGVTDGEARCFGRAGSLGVSSSLIWPCVNDAMSAMIARAVAKQRRKRATSSAP